MFENLTVYHKLALFGFVIAKMSGMFGVALGFAGGGLRNIGAGLLGFAFLSIFFSIGMSMIQMGRDRDRFEEEDGVSSKTAQLRQEHARLLEEVSELRKQRDSELAQRLRNRMF